MRTRGKRWHRVMTAAVIAGAMSPVVLRWLRRAGAAKRAVDMRMTIVVERPVAEVFNFCRDFENFPDLVDHLVRVDDPQDGRSHWVLQSRSGQTIEWDAAVTKYVPNSVIAWESVPGSPVQASGLMRFSPLSATETRLDITLAYLPKNTTLGQAIGALLNGKNENRLRSTIAQAPRAIESR